jgi:hypothetical protein
MSARARVCVCLPQRGQSVDTSPCALTSSSLSCSTHCLIGQCKTAALVQNLVDKTDSRCVTIKCYKKRRPVP